MEQVLFLTIAAVLVQQAPCSLGFSLFQPLHHESQPLHHGSHLLPVFQHNGFLADTHEVAAAKSAHLAAVAAHQHQDYTVQHQQYPEYHHELPIHHEDLSIHHKLPIHHQELPVHYHEEAEHPQKYHGPIAIPVVLHTGHLADTKEVALEKSHHLSAVAQAKADKYYSGNQEYGYGGSYGYSGSHHGYGIPVVLPNGHIADTKEVAAAKSAHLVAVAQAKADKYYSGNGEGYSYGGGYGYSSSYHGYGIPVVLPNGHLADTHEVAAAKAAHMTAVAHAKAEQAHSDYHHDEHEHYEHEPISYFVPHHTVQHVPHEGHLSYGYPQSYANIF